MAAIRSNPNQISGLVRQCGTVAVDAVLILALNEVFSLTTSPVTDLSGMAAMIRKNFALLRFEEILFALNKGINGGYGKIYGNLSYQQISEWITAYQDLDRAAAVDQRNAEKQGNRKVALTEAATEDGSVLGLLLKEFGDKREEEKKQAATKHPKITREYFDRNLLKSIVQMQSSMSDYELERMQGEATEHGYGFTADHIGEELERRYEASRLKAKEGKG